MVVEPVAQADRVERRGGPFAPLRWPTPAAVEQRQLDVLERRRARQQVEALEDEADLAVADVAPARVDRALDTSRPFST